MTHLYLTLRLMDHTLFHDINAVWTFRLFDLIMPVVSNLHRTFLIDGVALPALCGFWIYRHQRKAVEVIAATAIVVAVTFMVCHEVKAAVKRPRPRASGEIVVLRAPDQGYSFASNHAADYFAGAAFLGSLFPTSRIGLLAFAGLVAYSRVYVGVHFPSDVIAGGVLGAAIGWLAALVFLRWRRTGRSQNSAVSV